MKLHYVPLFTLPWYWKLLLIHPWVCEVMVIRKSFPFILSNLKINYLLGFMGSSLFHGKWEASTIVRADGK